MTKIYEALESAEQERTGVTSAAGGVSMAPSKRKAPRSLEEKFLALYQRIDSLLENEPHMAVQFSGVQPGEADSKMVCEFARVVSSKLRKKVLLLAVSAKQGGLERFPGMPTAGWGAVLDGGSLDDAIAPVDGTTLSVGCIAGSGASLPELLASPQAKEIMGALREQFDMIVVDAPALGLNSDGVMLATLVDGTLLIVESGKTRWQAIRNSMEQLEDQKARILGTVLTKQRHYIPGFIYRKL